MKLFRMVLYLLSTQQCLLNSFSLTWELLLQILVKLKVIELFSHSICDWPAEIGQLYRPAVSASCDRPAVIGQLYRLAVSTSCDRPAVSASCIGQLYHPAVTGQLWPASCDRQLWSTSCIGQLYRPAVVGQLWQLWLDPFWIIVLNHAIFLYILLPLFCLFVRTWRVTRSVTSAIWTGVSRSVCASIPQPFGRWSLQTLTLITLNYFCKTMETEGVFSIWNHHKCLS